MLRGVNQEAGNPSSSRSRHSTFVHIPKGGFTLLEGHFLNYVHCCSVHNSQIWGQPECLSMDEWIKKENVIQRHNAVILRC